MTVLIRRQETRLATGDVHVTYRTEEEKWAVEVEGTTRASSLHDTKAPAEQAGRAKAQENEAALIVHGKDGQVQERRSYKREAGGSRRDGGILVSKRLWLPLIVALAVLGGGYLVRRLLRG